MTTEPTTPRDGVELTVEALADAISRTHNWCALTATAQAKALLRFINSRLASRPQPAYDRDLISEMLDRGTQAYTRESVSQQVLLLRAADNADAAGVHTARCLQPAAGEVVAFRLLRKALNEEWNTKSAVWVDGKPDDELLADIAADPRWRIEYAYGNARTAAEVARHWGAGCGSFPEDGAYLIRYDDAHVPSEFFVGSGALKAARERFQQVSDNWNVHLFAKIESRAGVAYDVPDAIAAQPTPPGAVDEVAERAAFGLEYDAICSRPIGVREIAWRMWKARAALTAAWMVRAAKPSVIVNRDDRGLIASVSVDGRVIACNPEYVVAAQPAAAGVPDMDESSRVPDDFRGSARAYRAGWNDRGSMSIASRPQPEPAGREAVGVVTDDGRKHPSGSSHATLFVPLPSGTKLYASAPPKVAEAPKLSDADIAAWVDRHDLDGKIGSALDARCAFEDAQSAHMLPEARHFTGADHG